MKFFPAGRNKSTAQSDIYFVMAYDWWMTYSGFYFACVYG